MPRSHKILTIIIFQIIATVCFSQSEIINYNSGSQFNFIKISNDFYNHWEHSAKTDSSALKQFKRWEYYWKFRTMRDGSSPDLPALNDEYQKYLLSKKSNRIQGGDELWKPLGPYAVSTDKYEKHGNGRINCIAFHPNDPDIIWAGAATSGLWKSVDYGGNWERIELNFVSTGISAIAYSQSNPDVMYAVTGDAEAGILSRSYSSGLLKSADGGKTWGMTGFGAGFAGKLLIAGCLVMPDNEDHVIISTNRGIYKSTDGGGSWLLKSDSLYFKELLFKPGRPNVIYTSSFFVTDSNNKKICSIYKSTDAGETWAAVESFENSNRIRLAVCDEKPDKIWALISTADSSIFGGLYVSADEGNSWTEIEIPGDIELIKAQGGYNLSIGVSPADENMIYAGGIPLWKSTDGGASWKDMSQGIHVDHHSLTFSQHNSEVFSANDGGIFKSDGNGWENISNGLNITQFYRIGGNPLNDNMIFGGAQDNGTMLLSGGRWIPVGGGDGMECVVDYENPQYVYISMQYGALFRSGDGGRYFNKTISDFEHNEKKPWLMNFVLDPADPSVIYLGYENIWKSTDRGEAWEKISDFDFENNSTVNALAVAAGNPDSGNSGYIYFANDTGLYMTTDGGDSWSLIFTAEPIVTSIAVDAGDPRHVWVGLSGYYPNEKVYEFTNGEWKNISGSLPNFPVNCIEPNKSKAGEIYIGTDIGVFRFIESVGDWQLIDEDMPVSIISELELNYLSGRLRAATYGNGVWEMAVNDCGVPKPEIIQSKGQSNSLSLCQGDTLQLSVANPDDLEYIWSNGTKGPAMEITKAGDYYVAAMENIGDNNGDNSNCGAASDIVNVEMMEKPEVRINVLGRNPACFGQHLTLRAAVTNMQGADLEYLWSTGDTARQISLSSAGEYFVMATSGNGCYGISDRFEFEILPEPGKPEVIRFGDSLMVNSGDVVRWILDGTDIDNSNTSSIRIVELGGYQAEITDDDGCNVKSDIMQIGFDDKHNNDNKKDAFPARIVPNPNDGEFAIESYFESAGSLQMKLIDVAGRLILDENVHVCQGFYSEIININNISNGVYYLILQYRGGEVHRLIVKQ